MFFIKIILDKDAKEYIGSKSKDNSMNVSIIQTKSGCCATNELSVNIGIPKDVDRYKVYEEGGIKIYLQDGIIAPKNKISISLKKTFILKTLNVEGIYV